MYSEVLESTDDMRVKVVLDEGPEEPDNYSPLLRQDHRRGCFDNHIVQHVGWSDGYPCSDRIEEAARRWGVDSLLFAKYLRAYHGVTQMVRYANSDWVYVTFDDASWRQVNDLEIGASVNLDDYRAWCEGDVYGYVIEKKVLWKPVNVPADGDVTITTWEEVSSLWGIYGYEYAVAEAKADFES
jgi:hypothetical protein